MTKNTISNMDDVIDSRDVIERIEELRGELEGYHDGQDTTLDFDYALQDAANFPDHAEEYKELLALQALADEASGYAGDWDYGETLIRRSYWVDYVQELLADCGELPRDIPHYLAIDWDTTARNIEADYASVDYDGVEYLVRSY